MASRAALMASGAICTPSRRSAIGDQAGSLAANINTLRGRRATLHGARGRKSELAGCGLLQG